MVSVLVQSARSFTPSPVVLDTLAQIANACVRDLADYCAIDLTAGSLEGDGIRVTAGTKQASRAATDTISEPLMAGRHAFGTLTCTKVAPGGFDEGARRAIRVLASQVALVIAGRLWMLRERSMAGRLARSLLAHELPQIPGVRIFAAYRPGSNDAALGEWFDAFSLPDGRVAVCVGDVAGRGLDAAVVMGEVRAATRALAAAAASPATVLERLNAMVSEHEPPGSVTAAFGVYDPAASTLVYSVAGHPPPLLALPNGFIRRLPAGGLPLGCSPNAAYEDWTFTLPAQAHAVFYTDGMVAPRRGSSSGEERLLQALRAISRKRGRVRDPDRAADVLRYVFGTSAPRDDAALLLISREAPVASYTFSAVPVVAPIARAILEHEIAALDLNADRRFGLVVAVGEAIANSVEHAYRGAAPGLIRLQVAAGTQELVVTVEDFGRWRRVVRRGEQRGRGIDLMHAFVDTVQIRKGRDSTTIVLTAGFAS